MELADFYFGQILRIYPRRNHSRDRCVLLNSDMKTQVILLLFLFAMNTAWSQHLAERVDNVEKGLTYPMTVDAGKEIVKATINERLKVNKIHGASVAVINDGKIEWSRAYGVKEAGNTDPVTTETVFQCASIGKVITALAVLKLVEDGAVDLDEDVNNKLKRWRIKENENTEIQKVTLRHLLSHSAGLTDDYGFLGYGPKDEIPSLLQILNNDFPSKAKKILEIKTIPGVVERYSGGGYLIIQMLIEEISGSSFANYIQQQVFDPLKMVNSTYDYRPDKHHNISIAAGHRSNGKPLKNRKYNIYPEAAAAGPWTTAEDLARLIIGIQDAFHGKTNAILKKEAVQQLLKAQINNKGLGVNLKGIEQAEAFWHAGQNLGYTALLYGLTEKGKGAVVLLNSDGGERVMQEFITSVAIEYNWPVMKTYKSLEIPTEVQKRLAGRYVSANQSKELSIEQIKGTLIVKPSDSKKGHQLYRIGDNHYTFKNAQDYYKLSFDLNKNPKLVYTESIGKTIVLEKTK